MTMNGWAYRVGALLGILLTAAAWGQEPRPARERERAGQPEAGAPTPQVRVERMFEALDRNNDGRIDKEEFMQHTPGMMRRIQQAGPPTPPPPPVPGVADRPKAEPRALEAGRPGPEQMERRLNEMIERRVNDALDKRIGHLAKEELPRIIDQRIRDTVERHKPEIQDRLKELGKHRLPEMIREHVRGMAREFGDRRPLLGARLGRGAGMQDRGGPFARLRDRGRDRDRDMTCPLGDGMGFGRPGIGGRMGFDRDDKDRPGMPRWLEGGGLGMRGMGRDGDRPGGGPWREMDRDRPGPRDKERDGDKGRKDVRPPAKEKEKEADRRPGPMKDDPGKRPVDGDRPGPVAGPGGRAFGLFDANDDGRLERQEMRRAADLMRKMVDEFEGDAISPQDWERVVGKLGKALRQGPPEMKDRVEPPKPREREREEKPQPREREREEKPRPPGE